MRTIACVSRVALLTAAAFAFSACAAQSKGPISNLDGVSDQDQIWSILATGNEAYVDAAHRSPAEHTRRAALAEKQAPRVTILACADSRCSPEIVFDRKAGDLFVVRTAGNVADSVAVGSLEYSVAVLQSPVLMVLGHEHCGAVKAAVAAKPTGSAHIDGIVEMIRPAVKSTATGAEGEERLSNAVHENVRLSARHLVDASPIVAEAVASGRLRLVLAVHDIESGRVTLIK